MNKRIVKSLLIIVFGLTLFFGFSENAFATDFNVIKSKAALEGVWQCFSRSPSAYHENWSTNNGGLGLIWNSYGGEKPEPVKLPYGLTDAHNNGTDCEEIMGGFGTNSAGDDDYLNQGLVPKEIQESRSSKDIADFWEKAGYKANANSVTVESEWQTLTYAVKDKNKCTDSNGNLLSNKFKNLDTGESYDKLIFPAIIKVDEGFLKGDKSEFDNTGINVPEAGSYKTYHYEVCGVTVDVANIKSRADETAYKISGNGVAGEVTVSTWNGEYQYSGDHVNGSVVLKLDAIRRASLDPSKSNTTSTPQDVVSYDMSLIGPTEVIVGLNKNNKIGYSVPGLVGYDGLAFTYQEVYDLYRYYINDVYNVPVICEDQETYSLYDDNNSQLINWALDKKCRAHIANENVEENPGNVYGVDMTSLHFTKTLLTLQDVINALEAIDLSKISGAEQGGTVITPEPGETETDLCYKNSGSLGWIACPIITALHGIGNKMWNQIETYHMVVPASEVFKSGGGVEKGWGLVRDIANVLFVILFLVVIFSQLTGVGIDNYGIKKILPRLIVVAILVNLSYVICELAVDLSNILGMGLNNTLSNLAGNLAVAGDGASIGGQVVAWTLTGIFAVGGTFLWGLLSAESPAGALVWIGLAVLGIAIMIIAAMLFLYLTLVVREAGIVLSIVLAPVAIVCYALPNTEKMGKKWFDLFKAMLLVYPICGAMIGGGQLAGSILASIDNDGMKLAAAIVQVVPFFFIPMVLRNSLSLMGNVGAKLSSLGKSWGRKASGFAQNSIKSTNRYKDFTQYQQSQTAARRAQRVKDRLDRRSGGNVANLSARQQSRLASANQLVLENEKKQRQNAFNARDDLFNAAREKQNLEADNSAYELNLYNDDRYIQGKYTQSRLSRENDLGSTLLYNNGDYVQGKRTQNVLSRENDLEGAVLYTRPGFSDSKQRQYAANRQGEIRKMYSEQYSNMDKAGRENELIAALSGNGADAVERMDAAFDSLMKTGDVAEVLSAFNGADFTTMDADLKARAVALAAASGNQLLKGWAKTSGNIGLQDYINDTGTNGLRNYLNTQAGVHAFDNADKDTLQFLANNNGAQAMSNEMLASIVTTAANANQTATTAAARLVRNSGRASGIGAAINADGLTRVNEQLAIEIGEPALRGAITEINKAGNETLRSRITWSDATKTGFGIV